METRAELIKRHKAIAKTLKTIAWDDPSTKDLMNESVALLIKIAATR